MTRTLGAWLQERDATSFVGRTDELRRLVPRLPPDGPGGVVYVHGPPGVGKSALLRELARRGAAAGRDVVTVEARTVPPMSEAVEEALAPACTATSPLVLLDSWELLSGLDAHLLGAVLPLLPADALVVIASRRAPGRAWFSGGWERVATEVALPPLGSREADGLLRALGVLDAERRAEIGAWAGGSPLALVLGAEAPDLGGAGGDPPPRVAEALLRRLLDAEPETGHAQALAVAALARVTTPRLLAAALPEIDADAAFTWLRRRPFAEPLGDGVTVHDIVGRALRSDLERRAPERVRHLRRRIADALYRDALTGGLLALTLDLQHLVRDPAIRWGFAWDPSGRLRIDAVDAAELAELAAEDDVAARWHGDALALRRAAPEHVVGVRDLDDALAGYAVTVSPANAPAAAWGDPVLGPRLGHAAAHVPGGEAFVCRQAIDITGAPGSTVMGVLGIACVLGSGLENPRAAYLSVVQGDRAAAAFTAACGARAVPELAVELHGALVECHLISYGDGGLLGFQRAAVYRELGLAAPRARLLGADPEVVRDALRDFRSPAGLAASPLAAGDGTPAARAARLAERIDAAVDRAFGQSPEDRALRAALEQGYLRPAATHEAAADELCLSRAAYFRRLRRAVERLAAEFEP